MLGYVTPASGVVVSPVAPIGLRDRPAGTVSFTTSLGFGRKLERLAKNPKMSLAFAAREHGFARSQRFVLVQGSVVEVRQPDSAWVEANLTPRASSGLRSGAVCGAHGYVSTTRSGSSSPPGLTA